MTSKLIQVPSRTDYVEEVYKVLVDAICEGSLGPGTRLTQEEIAEQLSVSRSPVLQALRLLKKDGLVQDAPGRGVLVAPLDLQWLSNLYEIRGTLDALAARLAAGKRARLDPALITRGRQSSLGTDIKAMIDVDMAFHFAVYAASGNPLIADTARVHWVHLRRVMGAMLQASRQRASIWDEHEAIAEAIEAGRSAAAVEYSEFHTQRAHEHLIEELSAVLGSPSAGGRMSESLEALHV
ncbi:GntR family transcriptional regulator [Burkholderia lata]|uniref:GntR family transcriptional regulator n=1 Tax=Burkholderia lata (strain ATCC 17760 / DSM 23089 / LMG 22485 / NCIMB 9086 / R18194 / 383) TaxID=482957 RepID=UPI0014536936|nr:GntR family transcriptional regulator [Burkholderia lata]VWB87329.1 GntR-family transcriptional regulator [Burkholderia lata]